MLVKMKMFDWIKNKDRKEQLKTKYCALMRKAYKIAPRNKEKSDKLNSKARQLLKELRNLDLQNNLQ